MSVLRPLIVAAGIVAMWALIVVATDQKPFILPAPWLVAETIWARAATLADNAWVTGVEIVAGLACGAVLGAVSALIIGLFAPARRWLLPVLVVSQAVPVFALAPILTLWLGYGMLSKIAMATLIIYFPVTAAFYDGLRRTDPQWLAMARVMGGNRWRTLRHISMPSALPACASGLRVATAVAPIGAIVGEWVGASSGLGHLMLHANGRGQTDLVFAALVVLAVMSVALYFAMDHLLRRAVAWQPDRIGQPAADAA